MHISLVYDVDVDDLVRFIFPKHIQHPLSLPRLYAFAYYGPLDTDGNLRSGPKNAHILYEYELENMCLQFDREDIIMIFCEKPNQAFELSTEEQNTIWNQADARLKSAKGKAMMPVLTETDIRNLLKDVPRDAHGKLSFHEIQKTVQAYRYRRIKEFKLVYPPLATRPSSFDEDRQSLTKSKPPKKLDQKVLATVAPLTMFQHDVGLSDAEVVFQTTKNLSKHAFKISAFGESQSGIQQNIMLLRELAPRCSNPYERVGPYNGRLPKRVSVKQTWDNTASMKHVGLGSMVNATPAATTWKRKTTVY